MEPETSTTSAASPDEGGETPSWVWWVLAALVLAVLAGSAVAWAHARRGKHWREDLQRAEDEVAWFAHVLLPELRQSRSLDQVVGGWEVGSPRVGAAEDRLTVLESSAPSETDGARAQTLRDAVRRASQRLDSLTVVAPHDTWALDLDEVAQDLDVALSSAPQPEI
ncbi:hypothetical protein [Marmoricola sp. URHB0036]|uniref:hypothetical protein n=1 Tax=Marmoricola sp. URHB0036 TaxID=1298863 RepID=UPI000411B46C|nr:hypothetical protein [Marmoricola sp. URHB0036]